MVPAMPWLMRKAVSAVIECVVERRITMGGKIIKWLMLILCGVTGLAALLTINFLPSFLCTAGITAYYCRHYAVEFEYGFCGGVLTIDAIPGKRESANMHGISMKERSRRFSHSGITSTLRAGGLRSWTARPAVMAPAYMLLLWIRNAILTKLFLNRMMRC